MQPVYEFYRDGIKQADFGANGRLTFYGSAIGSGKIYQQDLNWSGAAHFIDVKNLSTTTSSAVGLAWRNDVNGFTQFYKASSTNANFQHAGGTLLRDNGGTGTQGGITFCNDTYGLFAFQKAAGSTAGANTYIDFSPALVRFKESQFLIGGTTATSSAKLQVDATDKGFLPPRLTTTQRTAISSPAEGLVVYDTDLHKLYCFDGTLWQPAW